MTDNAQPTDTMPSPQSKLKLRQSEKLLCGAFLGLNAAMLIGLPMIFPDFRFPILFAYLIPIGTVIGYFILPLFLSKDIRTPPYAFLGGFLAPALTWLLSYSIYIAGRNILGTIEPDEMEGVFILFYITGIFAFLVSLLVAFLTIFFDRALFRHRQKHAPIDSRIFE